MDAMVNFAVTTIQTAPSPADSGTDFYLTAGPPSPTAPYDLTVWQSGNPLYNTAEIIRILAQTDNHVTSCLRTQYGSVNLDIAAGFQCEQGVTEHLLSQLGGGSSYAGTSPQNPVWLEPVVTADWTGTLSNSASYVAGGGADPGVGATLVQEFDGLIPVIDGVTLALNDRVLVVNDSPDGGGGYCAGVYTVTDLGSVSTPWVLTRATDNDTAATLLTFWAVANLEGAAYIEPFGANSVVVKTWGNGTEGAPVGTVPVVIDIPTDIYGQGQVVSVVSGQGISVDSTDEANPVVNVTFSAQGALRIHQMPFSFDTPGLAAGISLPFADGYQPLQGDLLCDAWISIDTAWDGTTPQGDISTDFPGIQYYIDLSTDGFFKSLGLSAIDMTQADTNATFNPGWFSQPLGTPNSSLLQALAAANGAANARVLPASYLVQAGAADQPFGVMVSSTGVPEARAQITGDTAPNNPVIVVTGVNDEFVYTPLSTGIPETFTVAAGSYDPSSDQCLVALRTAIGSTSGEQFGTICYIADNGSAAPMRLIVIETGLGHNGDTLSFGVNDCAADFGFTGNPDTFAGATNLDPGATQGSGSLFIVTASP